MAGHGPASPISDANSPAVNFADLWAPGGNLSPTNDLCPAGNSFALSVATAEPTPYGINAGSRAAWCCVAAPTTPYPPPTYTPPPVLGTPPPVAPGAAVQPPPANWDPYATPGSTPSALLPQDPYFQSAGPPVSHGRDAEVHAARRPGLPLVRRPQRAINHQELGINDVELSVTFAFPMFYNSQTPLLVTPGFAVHYWEGPVSVLPAAPASRRRPICRREPTTPISTPPGTRSSRLGLAANWMPASASTPISNASPATASASRARAWPC